MALDGITIASLVRELNDKLSGGRFFKISQPENDELQITVKVAREQFKLLISANASLPLLYITDNSKTSPLKAPAFCMVLRKHLNNSKILEISQPGLERIITFKLEHYNEMGDLCQKNLIIELMGKHSNIIFTDDNNKIIESIKHVSANVSSLREVLPGRDYFIPESLSKTNPLTTDITLFLEILDSSSENIRNFLFKNFMGISPLIAEEISYRSNIDSDLPTGALSDNEKSVLYKNFSDIMEYGKNKSFDPVIIYENGIPKEFNSFPLSIYEDLDQKNYESVSSMLEYYYFEKSLYTRIRQKSTDLRKIITTTLEKDYKKLDIQTKQIADTEKKDKFKVYGELLTAYGYNIDPSSKEVTLLNYYTNQDIKIPLDNTISPLDNAKKYFEKYNKLKRTNEALIPILKETESEIHHLESLINSLDIATSEDDLKQIKEEMIQASYIKKKFNDKTPKSKSRPLHYISTDGFDIYVGKNNLQNEDITFKLANGGDWWFHSKTFPGSHVIVKSNGSELTDRTYEEAAKLAAFYSKGRAQEKVEIDYTERKNLKKVPGAKPGFVVYHTNYSMAIEPVITGLKLI